MYSSLCINSNCNVFLKQLIDKTHTQKMQCHVLSFTLKRKKQCFPGAHASSFVLLSNILCHLLLPPQMFLSLPAYMSNPDLLRTMRIQ